MNEKVYVNSMWFEKRTFTSSRDNSTSTILKLSIKADELIKFLNENKDENGRVKLDIWEKDKSKITEKGSTHYATLDNWVPKTQTGQAAKPTAAVAKPKTDAKTAKALENKQALEDEVEDML